MSITLMDCILRDGRNVVGKGFNAEITDLVLDGLTACGVPIIEFGNAGGIGAYEVTGFTKAETDETCLAIARKYQSRGSKPGMFLNAKRYLQKSLVAAKERGLSFLRVGADAGNAEIAIPAAREIKAAGKNSGCRHGELCRDLPFTFGRLPQRDLPPEAAHKKETAVGRLFFLVITWHFR